MLGHVMSSRLPGMNTLAHLWHCSMNLSDTFPSWQQFLILWSAEVIEAKSGDCGWQCPEARHSPLFMVNYKARTCADILARPICKTGSVRAHPRLQDHEISWDHAKLRTRVFEHIDVWDTFYPDYFWSQFINISHKCFGSKSSVWKGTLYS